MLQRRQALRNEEKLAGEGLGEEGSLTEDLATTFDSGEEEEEGLWIRIRSPTRCRPRGIITPAAAMAAAGAALSSSSPTVKMLPDLGIILPSPTREMERRSS